MFQWLQWRIQVDVLDEMIIKNGSPFNSFTTVTLQKVFMKYFWMAVLVYFIRLSWQAIRRCYLPQSSRDSKIIFCQKLSCSLIFIQMTILILFTITEIQQIVNLTKIPALIFFLTCTYSLHSVLVRDFLCDIMFLSDSNEVI